MKVYLRQYFGVNNGINHEVRNDVVRSSIWISNELARINDEDLENLLNVVLWFEDGSSNTFTKVIDCEVF